MSNIMKNQVYIWQNFSHKTSFVKVTKVAQVKWEMLITANPLFMQDEIV